MKKALKYTGYLALTLLVIALLSVTSFYVFYQVKSNHYLALAGPEAPLITVEGQQFRDLNKNGKLDIYEDPRKATEARIDDLLGQMTLAEKAGMMFITMQAVGDDGNLQEIPTPTNMPSLVMPINSEMVHGRLMNHFNIMLIPNPRNLAVWVNNMQKEAEKTRLGIPITIGSDPRHGFAFNVFASLLSPDFSIWPEPLGLAATNDTDLVRQFGDIARQEYVAAGIRLALHPMADLATEPRWGRINGTFGEDAHLTAAMVSAYVKGLQGEKLGPNSVAAMVKHFPASGARDSGHDSHFEIGKYEVFPGDNFDYHLIPYREGAFPAGVSSLMPAYGIQKGQTSQNLAASYNKEIVTELLRKDMGFDGVVCTDFGIVSGIKILGVIDFISAPGWGVEDLGPRERIKLLLENDIDLIGGDFQVELVIDLVNSGEIAEARLDRSVRRLLRQKFTLGLFDNPYVDPDEAERVVGNPEFREAGVHAQKKAVVLLKNDMVDGQPILPLQKGLKIYAENLDAEALSAFGQVVATPAEADVAILRLAAPYEPADGFMADMFHQGRLNYSDEEKAHIMSIIEQVPTVIDMYMDRPPVIPEIAAKTKGLMVNFGATDAALLDVLYGTFNPTGKLPMELPSSMEAVLKQLEDMPYDTGNPTFPFGYGLSYHPVVQTGVE